MISDALKVQLTGHCGHYPSRRVGLIFVMQKLQEHYGGWLPEEAIREAAEISGVPETEVEGVATFYNWFFREPAGRHIIVVCDSISCYLCGCDRIAANLERKLGIKLGETTPDGMFTLLPVVCLGNCDKAPSIMVDDELYGPVTADMIDEIIEKTASETHGTRRAHDERNRPV
ncbi:MAG: NADH-quinone oxidoreductase subunit NuoE [bacterium]|nr:NADH-quinone oxidoreductase subunit NuoE [Candidatus Sumerlaeota bacterium]